jgi:hypothetical protein
MDAPRLSKIGPGKRSRTHVTHTEGRFIVAKDVPDPGPAFAWDRSEPIPPGASSPAAVDVPLQDRDLSVDTW